MVNINMGFSRTGGTKAHALSEAMLTVWESISTRSLSIHPFPPATFPFVQLQ